LKPAPLPHSLCPQVLALMAVRAADRIVTSNMELIKSNVAAFQALVDEFPHVLAWTPPAGSSVAFPRLLQCPQVGTWPTDSSCRFASSHSCTIMPHCSRDYVGRARSLGRIKRRLALASIKVDVTYACCAQGIEAWCEQLIAAKGLALLPASIYDHAPSTAAGHFRLGLGRRDLPHCLTLLREHLLQLYGRPPVAA
jgi:aspartate/methionine/tyrosine aminotransferase